MPPVLTLSHHIHEAAADAIGVSATVSTMVQYFVAVSSCRKLVKESKDAAVEPSPLPYVCGLLCCAVWLIYSIQIGEAAMILVNSSGVAVHFACTSALWASARRKDAVAKPAALSTVCFAMIMVCAVLFRDRVGVDRTIVGACASALSVAFCAAPLANVGTVLRKQSTDTMPFQLILVT